jgi:hypothetical protein
VSGPSLSDVSWIGSHRRFVRSSASFKREGEMMSTRRGGVIAIGLMGTAIALAPGVFAAPPQAANARPVKTEFIAETFVLPAGQGCAFDVAGDKTGSLKTTEQPNGSVVVKGEALITITNLETGGTYLQDSRAKTVETYDPATNEVHVVGKGRLLFSFWPGDQGPNGVIGEPGALLAIDGDFSFSLDVGTFFFTSFSVDGQVTDLCAILS